MRDCDLADSPLASYWPDIAAAIDGEETDPENGEESPMGGPTIAGMRLLHEADSAGCFATRKLGYLATIVLKQLGLLDWSDQQIADHWRITRTRAAVNIKRRGLEERTGLRCRSSKTDETREACRARRIGVRREPPAIPSRYQLIRRQLASLEPINPS